MVESEFTAILVEQLDSLLADDSFTLDFADFAPSPSIWWRAEEADQDILPVNIQQSAYEWIDANNLAEPGTQQLVNTPPGEIHWVA